MVLHALLGAEIGDDQTDQLGVPAITRARSRRACARRVRVRPAGPGRRGAPAAAADRRAARADPLRAVRVLRRRSGATRRHGDRCHDRRARRCIASFHTTPGVASRALGRGRCRARSRPPAVRRRRRRRRRDPSTPVADRHPTNRRAATPTTAAAPASRHRSSGRSCRTPTATCRSRSWCRAANSSTSRRCSSRPTGGARSEISSIAGPDLRQEALQARSANIDIDLRRDVHERQLRAVAPGRARPGGAVSRARAPATAAGRRAGSSRCGAR